MQHETCSATNLRRSGGHLTQVKSSDAAYGLSGLLGTTFIEMMHDDDDEGQSYSEDLGINRRLFSGPKITGGGQARHRAKLRI